MKFCRLGGIASAAVAFAAFSSPAGAQQDISGVWAGELEVAPDTQLEVHFVLTRVADGAYTAVITSPDPDGVQDVAASAVRFEGDRLSLTVDALNGAYEGTLADGAIAGEWRQQGTALPLVLVPYEAPMLSQADIELLSGQWLGALSMGGAEITIVFRFETNADGVFVGFLDSPNQGARGLAISDIVLVDGELSFRIPQVRGEYTATVDEEQMTGSWSQGPQPQPLNMTRGEYTPTVASLGLSDELMAMIGGAWRGTLTTPGGDIDLTIRLERTADGGSTGYLDVPAQGVTDLPVSTVTYADDGRLSISFLSLRAAFAGDLAGDEATGEWTQGSNAAIPLTLTRERPGD